jgi:four helix bundle protein
MSGAAMEKVYDLEERTFRFAKRVRVFVKTLPRCISNFEDTKQVVRSSGSVGVNYIEANEALSPKDRVMRIKISRKEAKETRYWLRLLDTGTASGCEDERTLLVQEALELMNILAAILRKLEASFGE